jgi:multiple antibiotic resistance protein
VVAMREFVLAFVTLFVAVDILGTLPVYLGLVADLPAEIRQKLPLQSTLTATGVAVGFLLLGDSLLRLMGVSTGDFQVAGGLLLLVLSIVDLITSGKDRRRTAKNVGAVPLGTPLIVGPAVLATLVILVKNQGYIITLLALVTNMLLAFLILTHAPKVQRVLGEAGSEAVAKVSNLFLAAFAVSLIRRGLAGLSSLR